MCRYDPTPDFNAEWMRDRLRARDEARFVKLDEYVHARWQKALDIRFAKQWLDLQETIRRRAPTHTMYRWRADRRRSQYMPADHYTGK